MEFENLKELGLTENEIKIYVCLIREGELTAKNVADKTGLHRGYVYDTLNKLIDKGFINCLVKSGKKKFKAVSPESILHIFDEKKKRISELIPSLLKLYQKESGKFDVEVFEGKNGMKNYNKKMLRYCSKEPIKEFFQIGLEVGVEEHIMKYERLNLKNKAELIGLIKKLKRDCKNRKVLLDNKAKSEYRFIKEHTDYRYLPKKFDTKGINLNILNNIVAFEFCKGNLFAMVIKNKEFSDFFKNIFNGLWEISEK